MVYRWFGAVFVHGFWMFSGVFFSWLLGGFVGGFRLFWSVFYMVFKWFSVVSLVLESFRVLL